MSKKQKSTSQSTETRTPTNPSWVTEGLAGVGGSLQSLLGRNPTDFVAGASPLQTKAYQDAGNLSLSPLYGQAAGMFNNVAGAGPNTYSARGYDPTNATSGGYGATNAASQGYDAQGYTGQGYNATTGQATNFDAVKAGQARGYDAVKAGQAQGYDPTSASASTYSASSLLDGLDRYMSPYTGQVVDAALADYDYGAGQTRAIARSMTEGELARGRGSLSANLRDQGFTRGAGLSAQDAGFRNDASRFNADAQTRVSMSNADAANQAAAFRAAAANQFSLTDALAANEAARFNTGESNRFTLTDADAANRAAQANADAANRFGIANLDAANTASRFGADALNTSGQFNTQARNNALQFSSDAVNRANLANADAANTALRFGADASNRAILSNADAANTASRFGAGAQNDAGQFNAQAMDAALARQLSAGGALAGLGQTMGADTRSNIGLQAALGGDQRAIQQALQGAPLSVLQQIAQMYGGLPLNLLSGSTTTGNSSGTSKTWDPMDTAGRVINAAGTVATAFSDRRLKTDIERIGEREDGLGVYVYRYLWSPARFIGVMAQEVLKVKPEAVIHMPNGFMAVNYGKSWQI